jgi:hypothetical protein
MVPLVSALRGVRFMWRVTLYDESGAPSCGRLKVPHRLGSRDAQKAHLWYGRVSMARVNRWLTAAFFLGVRTFG